MVEKINKTEPQDVEISETQKKIDEFIAKAFVMADEKAKELSEQDNDFTHMVLAMGVEKKDDSEDDTEVSIYTIPFNISQVQSLSKYLETNKLKEITVLKLNKPLEVDEINV